MSYDVPRDPPEGMVDWMKEQGMLQSHALVYRAAWVPNPLTDIKERMVQLNCTACGGSMYADRVDAGGCGNCWAPAPFGFWNVAVDDAVISGSTTICPMCGKPVKVLHISDVRGYSELENEYIMTVGKVEDKLTLTGWRVSKLAMREGTEEVSIWPWAAYVVEEKNMVRLMGYQRCLTSISRLCGWEQRKTYMDVWGAADLIYPWDPEILKGTTAENSKLDIFLRDGGRVKTPFPVSYLRLWQKHRNVENLVMQGCSSLVSEAISKECDRSQYERPPGCPKLEEIRWKERKPAKMLGLTGEEYRMVREKGWGLEKIQLLAELKDMNVKLKLPEDLEACWEAGGWFCKAVAEKGFPVLRSVRYILKQKKKEQHTGASILKDYWDMAAAEGWDLTDDHIRYPKNLRAEHDRVNQIQQDRLDAERRKKLQKEYEAWERKFRSMLPELNLFSWEWNGILIRPAETPDELDRESKLLNHCVRTYKDIHAKGKTPIFFIRRKAEPEEPWYTLQLDVEKRTVLQNRGKCNCARTKEVQEFEQAWLKHIESLPKKKEDKIA